MSRTVLALLAAVAAGLSFAPLGVAGAPVFDVPFYALNVTHPNDMRNADLDRDGDDDLAVLDRAGGSLRTYFGAGDGGFLLHSSQRTSSSSGKIEIADMNEDGAPDVVVLCYYQYVDIFLNSGTGNLARRTFGLYSYPGSSVLAGDVDGDGHLDLIAAAGNSSFPTRISIARGVGDGTVLPQTHWDVPDSTVHASSALLGDLDGDGRLDLLLWGQGEPVYRTIGNGDGTFQPPVQVISTVYYTDAMLLADLDADGDLDLASYDGWDIQVWLGDGSGGFAPAMPAVAGSTGVASDAASVGALAVGDVDGDGDPDLVGAGYYTQVYRNDGAGQFTHLPDYRPGASSAAVLTDVDGDGVLDILVGQPDVNRIVRLRLTNGGRSYPMGIEATSPQIVDFNGDGRKDLITGSRWSSNLSVRLGTGDGGLGETYTLPGAGDPSGLATADFDGDGDVDIAIASAGDSYLRVLLGDGAGGVEAYAFQPLGQQPRDLAVADFDFDGVPDLVVADPGWPGATEYFVYVCRGAGDGTVAPPIAIPAAGRPQDVAICDANEDGVPDVAVACSGPDEVFVLAHTGAMSFVPMPAASSLGAPSQLTVADVDADGHEDIVVAGSLGTVFHRGSGAGTFEGALRIGFASPTSDVAVGDVDRDGDIDIVSAMETSNIVSVAPGPYPFASVPYTPFIPHSPPAAVRLVRFDADGLPDLVVLESFLHSVWIYRNITPGVPTDVEAEARQRPANPLHLPRVQPDGSVRITYTLARAEPVHLAVFDVRGRMLWSAADCPSTTGKHSVLWDRLDPGGRRVARGVYWVQLQSPQAAFNRKVVLLRR